MSKYQGGLGLSNYCQDFRLVSFDGSRHKSYKAYERANEAYMRREKMEQARKEREKLRHEVRDDIANLVAAEAALKEMKLEQQRQHEREFSSW